MRLVLYIFFLFAFCKLSAQTFLNYTENGRWGVLNERGEVVLNAKFSKIENYYKGIAPAQSYGKWGLIDSIGNTVVPFEYYQIKFLPDKTKQNDSIYYLASKINGFGLINLQNKALSEFEYRTIELSNSNYIGKKDDDLYYLGELGSGVLIDSGFNYMFFDDGLIQARYEDQKVILNNAGEEILSGVYSKIIIVNNCIIALQKDKKTAEIYDFEGKLILEGVTFENVDGYLVRLKDIKEDIGIIYNSIKNKVLYKGDVQSVDFFGEYVILETDSSYAIQDENGQNVVDQTIKKYKIEDQLLMLYESDYTFTIYNSELTKLAGPGIDFISYQKGFYWIRKDEKFGLIKNNRKILPVKYENIQILNTTIKGYPKKGIDIYTFDKGYNLLDVQSFTNVVGINSKLELDYSEDKSSNRDNGFSFGWYEDSLYSAKFEKYIKRWGVKCFNIDTACVKPVYVEKTPMNRSYTMAAYNKVSQIVPKSLPKIGEFPYRSRFDVVSNDERIIVNEIPFFNVDMSGFYGSKFTYCLSAKGPVLIDTSFRIIDFKLDYFVYGPKELNAYCVGATNKKYSNEDDKGALAVSAENWWRRFGAVIRGTNKVSHGPPNKFVEFENAKWGYLDDEGGVVHEAIYDIVHEFDGSSGIVETEGRKGAVNNDTLIVPLNFSQINYFEGTKDTLLRVTSMPSSNYFILDSLAEASKVDYELIVKSSKKQLDTYIPIRKNGKYGLINRKGEVIIEPVFKRKPIVKDNYLMVKEKKYGLYDFEGNQLTDPVFKKIVNYQNDFVIFEKSRKLGVANSSGELLIPANFVKIKIRKNTIFCESKFGSQVYNYSGELISNKKLAISDYDENTATWVEVKKTTTKVHNESKTIKFKVKDQYSKIEFINGFFKIESAKNKYQLVRISEEFRRLVSGEYDDIQVFSDSLFKVTKKKKEGLISISGQVIMYPKYKEIIEVFEGVYAGVSSNNIDVYDKYGNHLLDRRGKHVYKSDNSMFLVQTNGGYEFINRKMENPFYIDFENAEPFAGDYASVSKGGKWCVINKFGEELFEKSYSHIKPIANNIFYAREQTHYGLYNLKGEIIAEPIYDKINFIDKDIIQVIKEGKIGYLRCNGSWIFNPFQFSDLNSSK